MVYKTRKGEIEAYYKSEFISQSRLKLIKKGLHAYKYNKLSDKELYYEEKDHFVIGNGVDIILTDGMDAFHESFEVTKAWKKPSTTLLSLLHYIKDQEFTETNLDALREPILERMKEVGIYSKMSDDVKMGKVTVHQNYYKDLLISDNKVLITDEQNTLIFNIVRSFYESEYTRENTLEGHYDLGPNIDVYFQLAVYWVDFDLDTSGIECKALLDKVIVYKDTDGKILSVTPIDFKTTSRFVGDFEESFYEYGYDIQAAWYDTALRRFFKDKPKSKTFKIEPMLFYVESTRYVDKAQAFKVRENTLEEGRLKCKDLLKELHFYIETNFEIDFKVYNRLVENKNKFISI